MNSFSKIYASSLFSLANDEGRAKEVLESIKTAEKCFLENKDYCFLLDSPMVPLGKRLSLIDDAFSSLDEYAKNFIKILCEKKSTFMLSDCVKQYEKLFNKENNIEKVIITTAVKLSEELSAKLCRKLEETYNKTVIADFKTDKGLLGGILIQTENSEIDASVRTRLDAIKSQICNEVK